MASFKFSHIMLFVRDFDRALNWYRETLGFRVDYCSPGEYVSLWSDDFGKFSLHATEDARQIGAGPMPYFLCENLDETVAHLNKKGIDVTRMETYPESPRLAQFSDSEGNIFGIEEQ